MTIEREGRGNGRDNGKRMAQGFDPTPVLFPDLEGPAPVPAGGTGGDGEHPWDAAGDGGCTGVHPYGGEEARGEALEGVEPRALAAGVAGVVAVMLGMVGMMSPEPMWAAAGVALAAAGVGGVVALFKSVGK